MINRFPASVTRELKHYVYLYIDPETKKPFYVGKGTGNRAFSHLDGTGDSSLAKRIRKLRRGKQEPRIDILVHGLKDEKAALTVEMAAIGLLGVDKLTNTVRGHHNASLGRMSRDQLLSRYQRKPAKIIEPAILIRINDLYRYDMSEQELYDATRGVWVIGPRREEVEYALAVYQGIVRQVYKVAHWLEAGSTFYSTRTPRDVNAKGRWEFVGTIAPERIRKKYVGRAVDHYFTKNSQNAIKYVP